MTSPFSKPFAFAGLWEAWCKGEEPVESCTILTLEANDLMRPLHDRMPVILDVKDFGRWLDPAVQDPKKLEPLLVPYRGEDWAAYAISTWVNSPRNQGPKCIEPLAAGQSHATLMYFPKSMAKYVGRSRRLSWSSSASSRWGSWEFNVGPRR